MSPSSSSTLPASTTRAASSALDHSKGRSRSAGTPSARNRPNVLISALGGAELEAAFRLDIVPERAVAPAPPVAPHADLG